MYTNIYFHLHHECCLQRLYSNLLFVSTFKVSRVEGVIQGTRNRWPLFSYLFDFSSYSVQRKYGKTTDF